MSFAEKKVVVTGGAQGIGRAIAQEFLKLGSKVAVIDQAELAYECDYFLQADLAAEENLVNFAETVLQKFGRVDFLINNACLSKAGILSGCSYEDFLYVQKVSVVAPYFLSKLFQEHFSPQAAIVNLSSTREKMSQQDTESYSAAKGGIGALTHALAISLAGKVRVNAISPGWINTTGAELSQRDKNQHPVKRVGQPEDIVQAVLFLCNPSSGFITGQNLTIDGGMSKLMVYHDDFGWTYNGS